MKRREDLNRLYEILSELRDNLGGYHRLVDCDRSTCCWTERGVYFFFEDGEYRENICDLRVVRVGINVVSARSSSDLGTRLSQHRGHLQGKHPGGGNHRASVFRLHVGSALLARNGESPDRLKVWLQRKPTDRESIVDSEYPIEKEVSRHIGMMPFLWVNIPDDSAGGSNLRRAVEASAIALLSNFGKEAIDPPSSGWLGHWAAAPKVRESGLWNVKHVNGGYSPDFLDMLQHYVAAHKAKSLPIS